MAIDNVTTNWLNMVLLITGIIIDNYLLIFYI